VTIAGWIAQTVKFPVIMDGDTGHGGIMAVRRMVRECIRAGIAGVRIDDQPIEGKRRTQSAGVEVVPLEQAVARYRAAVDMKNELDPDFVVMAQCYARDAAGGGLVDCLRRLRAYESEAGVDWVQFESPHSEDEIRRARSVVKGPFSFMKGKLPRYLGLDEHLALGATIAWYPGFTHQVIWAAMWDFMQQFQAKGIAAWEEFEQARRDLPYPRPEPGPDEEGLEKQRQLEERYFSAEALATQGEVTGGATLRDGPSGLLRVRPLSEIKHLILRSAPRERVSKSLPSRRRGMRNRTGEAVFRILLSPDSRVRPVTAFKWRTREPASSAPPRSAASHNQAGHS